MGGGPVAAALWARTAASTCARRSAYERRWSGYLDEHRAHQISHGRSGPPEPRPETGTVMAIGSIDSPLLSKSGAARRLQRRESHRLL